MSDVKGIASIKNYKDSPTLKNTYINRELSWLAFNQRVLEEANNTNHPLLERLKFLSISGSNLDEFYMIRVAGLHALADEDVAVQSVEGMTPQEQLIEVNKKANQLMINQQKTWKKLKGILKNNNIRFKKKKRALKINRSKLENAYTIP